jgi:hypothetical protein
MATLAASEPMKNSRLGESQEAASSGAFALVYLICLLQVFSKL